MKKVIKDFIPSGGRHCITTALKQIFTYYGYPLSEDMLFGLGEGLDFTYVNLANSPMVSGRTKIIEFEQTLAQRLGIAIKISMGKDYGRIFSAARRMIDANQPVLVYVDMPYLPYLSMSESGHFGGHAVVIFGYDDEEARFYVSDRDHSEYPIHTPKGIIAEDYHFVGYEQMQQARTSSFRPFPANNKYISQIDFKDYQGVRPEMLLSAVSGVCRKMLMPPAKLKGIKGIEKFSKEIVKWASFDKDKLKRAGVTNYFQINKEGGTGGGIFRKMFGNFLLESSDLLYNNIIRENGMEYISLSKRWDRLADDMWKLSAGGDAAQLSDMSQVVKMLHDRELELLIDLQKECDALLSGGTEHKKIKEV